LDTGGCIDTADLLLRLYNAFFGDNEVTFENVSKSKFKFIREYHNT